MKRSKLILAGLVLVHIVLGLWFNTATPIFEAPDEDGHYLFIRYLQLYHSLPVQTLDTQGPRAHHPPLFHLMAAALTACMRWGWGCSAGFAGAIGCSWACCWPRDCCCN